MTCWLGSLHNLSLGGKEDFKGLFLAFQGAIYFAYMNIQLTRVMHLNIWASCIFSYSQHLSWICELQGVKAPPDPTICTLTGCMEAVISNENFYILCRNQGTDHIFIEMLSTYKTSVLHAHYIV